MRLLPLFPNSRARPGSNRRRPTSRLTLQPLEDRLCPSYTTIDLGTLGATYTSSSASAVNASGQVVVQSATADGYNHAFLWQNATMTDLGTLGGLRSGAGDINDAGQIVGGSFPAGATNGHAFLWQNGIMTDLGTLGGDSSGAVAINNHGQIVGYSKTAGGNFGSFVWENGVMYDLDALLPVNSGWVTQALDGIDVNDNGQIAGTGLLNGVQRAFLITDNDGTFANGGSTITSLGTLGGGTSQGNGINSSGQVVGDSGTKDGRSHAFRFSAGVMTDLKTLIGNPTIGVNVSYASAINDAGQIIGTSIYDPWAFPYPSYHAVLWQNGKINDLNKQLPRGSSWVLESAYDINGAGQIVGQGTIGGQRHAFLMVPSGSALQAVAAGSTAGAQALSPNQAQPLLAEALARGQAAGVDTTSQSGVDVRTTDLGGATLGLAVGHTIWLPDNAAGRGWFVDKTPSNDSEFTRRGNQGEQHRMDLLTVLTHEVGHPLGHDHVEGGAMAETLAPGERLTFSGVFVGDPETFAALPGADETIDPIRGRRKA